MKRRRAIGATVIVLLVAAGLAIGLDPDRRALGWARGEPFYRGRAASAWQRELHQSDEASAAEAFGSLVAGKKDAVPVCAWILRTAPEADARSRAADALGKIGKEAAPAGPDLVAALADDDPLVRRVAARAIGELAPDVPGAIPALVKMFPDIEAIRAVARFGPAAAEAVPALLELFRRDDPTVRW